MNACEVTPPDSDRVVTPSAVQLTSLREQIALFASVYRDDVGLPPSASSETDVRGIQAGLQTGWWPDDLNLRLLRQNTRRLQEADRDTSDGDHWGYHVRADIIAEFEAALFTHHTEEFGTTVRVEAQDGHCVTATAHLHYIIRSLLEAVYYIGGEETDLTVSVVDGGAEGWTGHTLIEVTSDATLPEDLILEYLTCTGYGDATPMTGWLPGALTATMGRLSLASHQDGEAVPVAILEQGSGEASTYAPASWRDTEVHQEPLLGGLIATGPLTESGASYESAFYPVAEDSESQIAIDDVVGQFP